MISWWWRWGQILGKPKEVIRIRISKKEQTTQWPKEKGQKDQQRPTKHTHKTKDRVTLTPLKTGGELRCSGRVNSSCSTSGTNRVLCSCLQNWRGKWPYFSSIVHNLNNHILYMVIFCARLVGIIYIAPTPSALQMEAQNKDTNQ